MRKSDKTQDNFKVWAGCIAAVILTFGFGVQFEQERILENCNAENGYTFYLNGHKKIKCKVLNGKSIIKYEGE